MKKKFAFVFIFTLSLFTIVQFAMANAFPGIVEGSIADADTNKGTVKVTNSAKGATLKLYLKKDDEIKKSYTLTGEQTSYTFTDVDPGKYYVTSTTTVGEEEIVSDSSATVDVKPSAVKLKLSSTLGSTEIIVTGGIAGSTFTLYNENNPEFEKRTLTASNDGSQKFTDVPVGKNYRVTQTVDGAESALSANSVDIIPKAATLEVISNGGPDDKQGIILVTGTKLGNILTLYKDGQFYDKGTVTSPSGYTFYNLPAGFYHVVQEENTIEGLSSEPVEVKDEMPPVITLNGENPLRVALPAGYTEPKAKAVDNKDGLIPVDDINMTSIPKPVKPGTYTITYTAKDKAGNEAVVTREVIIAPKKVSLTTKNTDTASSPHGKTGDIIVNDVMDNATLYLYQGGVEKERITSASNPYTFEGVAVGKDYYVVQEVEGIKSDPSPSVEILDKTKPVLAFIGDSELDIIMGERYIEPGVIATDNIDTETELHAKIKITGTINENIPGKYYLHYDVKDKGNNPADRITRTINVLPPAVTAIGSTADIGQIHVKGILPGNSSNSTTLEVYKKNPDGSFTKVDTVELTNNKTSEVLEKYEPGLYHVIQKKNGQPSLPSNEVEIIDIDIPHITLNGPDKLSFVWDESTSPYYDGALNKFVDPGATAYDYLDLDLTGKIQTKSIKPNGSVIESGTSSKRDILMTEPGVYTITYNVTAARGKEAEEKMRTITVAPAPPVTVNSFSNKSQINVSSLFPSKTTVVHLYNAYGQLIESVEVPDEKEVTIHDVPAGLGYYVTQTVNGIESGPSAPVNVNPHQDADADKLIGLASFSFKGIATKGKMDQDSKEITITVPENTDVTSLVPIFGRIQNTEIVKVNDKIQTSGVTEQDFTEPVKYTVISAKNSSVTKVYTVTVLKENRPDLFWNNTVKKNVTLNKGVKNTFTLTAGEKRTAAEQGMSFIANDVTIHVSPANIKESLNPAFTFKDVKKESFIDANNDPDWTKNLKQMIEIDWNGSKESFLQPIEVEIKDPEKQSFVRLVREDDGKLYAFIQPKYANGAHIVGLATMPGTYAFLDQTVTATIERDGSDIHLKSNQPDAAIYYTTTGKDLIFERSANTNTNSVAESYLFHGPFSFIAKNWSKAVQKNIDPVGKDIYAIAVHEQIISSVASSSDRAAENWNTEAPMVERSKVWRVKFNSEIEKKSLFSNVIYVWDDTKDENVPILLSLDSDHQTVSVVPAVPYQSGHHYTLWIEKPVQSSRSKEFLKQPIKHSFIVK